MSGGAAPPPVFIVGLGRSGTTLLYRILQLQKPFALGPGRRGGEGRVDLTESRLFRDVARLRALDAPEARELRQFLLFDREAVAHVEAAARTLSPARAELLWRARPRLRGPRLRAGLWRATRADRLARVYLDAAREARGVARLVEKSPIHALYLPELRATAPAARILFAVRDPVEAFASLAERARRSRAAGRPVSPWLTMSPERFARWARPYLARGMGELRRGAPDLLPVRYEDLVADPVATLGRIAAFLDEPLDPGRLPGDDRDDADSVEEPRVLGPIRPEPARRPSLDPAAAALIARALARERAFFGYEAPRG